MKNQRFRFKLITLLLMGLIVLSGVYGLRTIPFSDASPVSLRDAILRLTGQASPAPSAVPPETSDPSETEQPAPTVSPSSSASTSNPDDSSATSVPPLSEALSNYFGSTETPSNTPSPVPASTVTP